MSSLNKEKPAFEYRTDYDTLYTMITTEFISEDGHISYVGVFKCDGASLIVKAFKNMLEVKEWFDSQVETLKKLETKC